MTSEECIKNALDMAYRYGQIDGDHHKAWVIDQMVRALTGCATQSISTSVEYDNWIKDYETGQDTDYLYDWDTGITP